MSTSILDQVCETASAERAELLADYRRLLAVPNPEQPDADRLLDVSRALGIPLSQIPGDMAVVRDASRFEHDAADVADSQATLEAAFHAADKHRVAMEKEIDSLREAQARLDAEVSSGRCRLTRAENARRELTDLRAEHVDLFADLPDEEAEADRDRLENLASELPAIRAELDQAEAALAAAEKAFDVADAEVNRTPPHSKQRSAVIDARTSAMQARDAATAKIANLYIRAYEAESARHKLTAEV